MVVLGIILAYLAVASALAVLFGRVAARADRERETLVATPERQHT